MMDLNIMGKKILTGKSPVLYDRPFSKETLDQDWKVYHSEWTVEDGWLTGRNRENAPGMAISRADYPGNVLLEFASRTVLPCTHDIDVMWNGSWDEEKDERGPAYVGGLAGWWEGKVGLEKSPDYKLNAATTLFPFEPGRIYRIQAGAVDGHCFMFVDGALVLEMTDPDPLDTTVNARIGFEAYCSHIQVRDLTVRSIVWEAVEKKYIPEF